MKAAFGKFGEIVDVHVPVNQASNQNRGFGFVEFKSREEANTAISTMNNFKFKGRSLTVEFSVPKLSYEKRIESIVEHTNLDRKDAIKPLSVKVAQKEEQAATVAKEKEKKAIEESKTRT